MKLVALITVAIAALAQSPLAPVPDCAVNFTFTATGTRPLFPDSGFNNRQVGCMAWTVVYTSSGFSALSLQFESAPDSSGVPGAYVAFAGTIMSGINPNTATTQAGTIFSGYFPWVRINASSVTGSGTITGVFYGWRNPPIAIGSSAGLPTTIQGQAADGAAVTGNPVRIGGKDGSGNTQDIITDMAGRLDPASVSAAIVDTLSNTVNQPAAGAVAAVQQVLPSGFNGTTWDRIRNAALANYFVATSTTGINSLGAFLNEKGARWEVRSNPAAGSQATASLAAEASVRHVADCVSFSAGSTTAPVLTALTVNLRDGATGAGTVIWSQQVIIAAATGQNVTPFSFCGLNLVGTTNTAMTLEFSAALANLIESVSLTGFNVN